MGDSRQHKIANLGSTIGMVSGAFLTGAPDLVHLGWLVGGSLLGNFITPDLDLIENRRKWTLTKIIWYPYGILFRHRSAFSHWPILGTFIRLIYMALLGLIVATIAGRPGEFIAWATTTHELQLLAIGLAIADTVHFALDMSGLYKIKRRSQVTKRRRGSDGGRRP